MGTSAAHFSYICCSVIPAASARTPASSFSGTYSASGGLGTQVGFGYEFNDHWSLEGDLRILALKLDSTDSSGTKVDYGTGYFATGVVTGRFTF